MEETPLGKKLNCSEMKAAILYMLHVIRLPVPPVVACRQQSKLKSLLESDFLVCVCQLLQREFLQCRVFSF